MKKSNLTLKDESTVKSSSGRGGARPGAGRKRGSGKGFTTKVQVCVTPEQKDRFELLGAADWLRSYLNGETSSKSQVQSAEGLLTVEAQTNDMAQAGIFEGDLLTVDTHLAARHQDTVVVIRKGKYAPGRIKFSKSELGMVHTERLKGKNRAFDLADVDKVQWVGVVTGIARKLR